MSGRGRGRGRGRFAKSAKPVQSRDSGTTITLKKFLTDLSAFCSNADVSDGLGSEFLADLKQYLMEAVTPFGIRFKLEEVDPSSTTVRLLLNTDRNTANFRVPLTRNSNGTLVCVERDDQRLLKVSLLVVSSNEFSSGHSTADVEQLLRDGCYRIVEIQDGTTFNMFYWRNAWRKSTRNAFDLTGVEWRGIQYLQAIQECFAEYPLFDAEKLDKDCVYTFGYRHPKQHPFNSESDPESGGLGKDKRMWLVNVYNRATMTVVETEVGIPRQTVLSIKDILPDADQNVYNRLNIKCEGALGQYLHSKIKVPFFGYILRSTDPRAALVSDILLESSLFTEIKKCIYDLGSRGSLNKEAQYKSKADFSNFNHVVVNSWLDFSKREMFFALFPQYVPQRERFDQIVDTILVNFIKKPSELALEEDPAVATLAPKLLAILGSRSDANIKSDKAKLRDILMNPAYTDMYLAAFY